MDTWPLGLGAVHMGRKEKSRLGDLRKDEPETVGPVGGGGGMGEAEGGRVRAGISRPSLAANELGGLGRHFLHGHPKGRIWGSDLWVLFGFTDFLL